MGCCYIHARGVPFFNLSLRRIKTNCSFQGPLLLEAPSSQDLGRWEGQLEGRNGEGTLKKGKAAARLRRKEAGSRSRSELCLSGLGFSLMLGRVWGKGL